MPHSAAVIDYPAERAAEDAHSMESLEHEVCPDSTTERLPTRPLRIRRRRRLLLTPYHRATTKSGAVKRGYQKQLRSHNSHKRERERSVDDARELQEARRDDFNVCLDKIIANWNQLNVLYDKMVADCDKVNACLVDLFAQRDISARQSEMNERRDEIIAGRDRIQARLDETIARRNELNARDLAR